LRSFYFVIIKSEVLKLNTEELERYLRSSTLTYPLKASWLVHDVSQNPCPSCPFQKEDPSIPISMKEGKCFERCPFNIIIWILNKEQEFLYEKFRPDDKKKSDLEMAINAHKIIALIK
jgi:hypothetical protein